MSCTIKENYGTQHPKCQALENANRANNYIKAFLIKTYMLCNGVVLDMPCGKGGDLKKFRAHMTAFYMGIDLLPASIDEARKRYVSTKCMFGAIFDVRDFTLPLDLQSKYDLVSCQFAMHYAWDQEERARQVKNQASIAHPFAKLSKLKDCSEQVLRNACANLKAGGYFIVTIPDYDEIMARLVRLGTLQDQWNTAVQDEGLYRFRVGGEHHFIEFETNLSFTAFISSLKAQPFGHKYLYYQAGAVERVPEYLIPPQALAKLAAEEGLCISSSRNFLHMLGSVDHQLLKQIGATTELSPECKSVVGLFRAIVMTTRKRKH